MKIALVALPRPDEPHATPPLPLCYVAAFLEQQRHIVRIYDQALYQSHTGGDYLEAIRAFRPQVTIVAADNIAEATAVAGRFTFSGTALPLLLGVRDHLPPWLASHALAELNRALPHAPEVKRLVACALLALDDDLDRLPLPARHLLELERYPLTTPDGELRTPVLIGRSRRDGTPAFRQPALLMAELRSLVQEHGVRNVILSGLALTDDLDWLYATLSHLSRMHLGIRWEGQVSHTPLTATLLESLRRSGCEALTFEFAALAALESKSERDALTRTVRQARELGMRVTGCIALDPQYPAIPAVVDMSATFGLDEVRFFVSHPVEAHQYEESTDVAALIALAREHYRASRSRQYFIDRFGAPLGTMIWHVGRTGLFGKRWLQPHETQNEIALEHGR
ncbi:MAG: hypothetical protein ACUVSW_16965 [Roseiflexus sp.]